MGFGAGNANGPQVSTLLGTAGSVATGLTLPLFFAGTSQEDVDSILNFRPGRDNPITLLETVLGFSLTPRL